MEHTTKITWILVGLIIGIIGTGAYTKYIAPANQLQSISHVMPDGSMMSNVGMDMDSMMDGMMADLKGKTGDAFDKAFLAGMIVHHQGAVEMAQAVLKSSQRPEMIQLANDIIAAQTKEIEMMRGWQKTWFSH